MQIGRKEKFDRGGHRDKDMGTTLSGQEIIQEVIKTNSALIPITVTELVQLGTLYKRFIYGKDTIPLPLFNKDKIHTESAARLACSNKVPRGILPRVN